MAAAAPAFSALPGCSTTLGEDGQSALPADPDGWLNLPEGFSYTRFSTTGETMSDGLLVPTRHDGMGCFPVEGDGDRCVLVRNHEVRARSPEEGAFGADYAGLESVDRKAIYDFSADDAPLAGGTTTLVYNTKTRQLERSHLSLAGTDKNCSGGITPWGSWLTCEETLQTPGRHAQREHGYVFEVPAAGQGLTPAVPLKAMGRFEHEAAAIDPRTGIVYMTEDDGEGLFYRFLPETPGELVKGGRLQALVLLDQAGADTRNWDGATISQGQTLRVRWIDMAHVESPDGDLKDRGFAAGAARFARGEGLAWAIQTDGASAYFACTNGGAAKVGQIWRYAPSPYEGTAREADAPGMLTLHYESQSASDLDYCDNIVASPWGHLTICEDADRACRVHGLTPDGRLYTIAENPHPEGGEFAGACWSPDGSTLFVNIQTPGATYAITGPWERLAV
ncbi:MAG: alkaline phosphatase PhoX [Pseudomonadota bacterium]